ncbi:MAG TPA: hypothetical protein PKW79_00780 [Rhabdochlamydiaceae bacterium]|nr:hypothetical protein [Rhabdochlamydiaceae bacterium]
MNKSFPKGLRRLVEAIAKSDFKGHILYQVGGWPNVEAGDLSLVDVPYAFKVSFFREAKRLGYQRALWLDTSILPVVSLNQIFAMIEEDGYFVMGNNWMLQPFMDFFRNSICSLKSFFLASLQLFFSAMCLHIVLKKHLQICTKTIDFPKQSEFRKKSYE